MVMTEKRLFTVDEYHRLFEVGILSEQDRVELIDGEIIRMPPIGPWHADRTNGLTKIFERRVGLVADVSNQSPILLSDLSEPIPDVALIPPGYQRTVHGHPRPADIWLLVEVADSSAEFDLETKSKLYAREGVVEFWVVNRREDELVVHRDPGPTVVRGGTGPMRYRTVDHRSRGERIQPLRLPEIEFTVDELLGPPLPEPDR